MFLTTNQVADFDVAIPSRIHVAIRYESLGDNQTEAIFYGFLDKLENQGLIQNYDEIKDWLEEQVYREKLDGRQIRNIVTTALGLARAGAKFRQEEARLTVKHMKRAFENTRNFKIYFNTQMERYKDGQLKMIK
jgi:ATP-dependent Clp protease ATP-binding subunit ClpA